MRKWARALYQPVLPLGEDGRLATGCDKHIALSRRAAGEGAVLLKNEKGLLPLPAGTRVALFGKGCVDYVKGGGGSGDVTTAYVRSISQGMALKEQEGKLQIFPELTEFYTRYVEEQYQMESESLLGAVPGMIPEAELPKELAERARVFADTAVIAISRFSGEAWDRKSDGDPAEMGTNTGGDTQLLQKSERIFDRGDFYLTDKEKNLVDLVCRYFDRVAVVLNVGGVVDTEWFRENEAVSSVLLAYQGGMEGGLAVADILCGEVNPSGKLPDTFARTLADYPSSDTFHESPEFANYYEDIYVGYRYFETIPGAAERVNYPFGYGLSYTQFRKNLTDSCAEGLKHTFYVAVTNAGNRSGREVVSIYVSAPQGKLGKPGRQLAAFAKTRELLPGETQQLTLQADLADIASYDDTGAVAGSAFVLEQGEYRFYLGGSVRDAIELPQVCRLEEDQIIQQLSPKAIPHKLPRRMRSDGSYEELSISEDVTPVSVLTRLSTEEMEGMDPEVTAIPSKRRVWIRDKKNDPVILLEDVAAGERTLEEFMEQLSQEQIIRLLGGQPNRGVANTYGFGNIPELGVPNMQTADGPAGVRIAKDVGVNTTAWPCATLLCATWDTELLQAVGQAGGLELKENNLSMWLTPAVNIHRSPLCGRNFEYYSEDPYLAGHMAAAMVRGIQSNHVSACVKHFACNNKETNRKASDSRVSERALREIYLKQFEIIIKTAKPYAVMTAYNLINGVQASEHSDLITGILRDEWGFEGMVTTDWWTAGEHYLEAQAGNDLKMGNGYPERVKAALEQGAVSEEELRQCAGRILETILRLD